MALVPVRRCARNATRKNITKSVMSAQTTKPVRAAPSVFSAPGGGYNSVAIPTRTHEKPIKVTAAHRLGSPKNHGLIRPNNDQTKTTNTASPLYREVYYHCRNPDACGHEFVVSMEAVRATKRSRFPKPLHILPLTQWHAAANDRAANDDGPPSESGASVTAT